jgi:hypothetical protein
MLSTKLRRTKTRSLNVVAEALFVLAQLGDHLSVGTPHGLDVEQLVHALEWNTLGFGDKEVYEYDGAHHQRCEEEVHAVTHGCEHLRGETRDEEVPQPVGGGSAGLGQGTHVGIEHFLNEALALVQHSIDHRGDVPISGDAYRVENPRGTIPGRSIEDGPQIKEEHGRNTTAAQAVGGVLLGLSNLDVCAHDPQADRTTCSTDQQQVTATDVVDQPKQPDESHYGLHHTEDSGGEQTSVGTPDTNLEAQSAFV